MEKYLEVMRRIIELMETSIECLNYISACLNQGYMEDVLYLVDDVVQAFSQILYSIQVLDSSFFDHELIETIAKVEIAIHSILSAYEHRDINFASYSVNNLLLPAFQSWKKGLSNTFNPHILS